MRVGGVEHVVYVVDDFRERIDDLLAQRGVGVLCVALHRCKCFGDFSIQCSVVEKSNVTTARVGVDDQTLGGRKEHCHQECCRLGDGCRFFLRCRFLLRIRGGGVWRHARLSDVTVHPLVSVLRCFGVRCSPPRDEGGWCRWYYLQHVASEVHPLFLGCLASLACGSLCFLLSELRHHGFDLGQGFAEVYWLS